MARFSLSSIPKINKLSLLTVVLPTSLAVLYFGVFASDVYVSKSSFVVRSPDKQAASGLGVLLKTAGFSNSGDEVYAAKAFVESRDALNQLDRDGAFRKSYSSEKISIFDRFGAFGWFDSFEDLFKYYGKNVMIETSSSTTISTLTVKAYSPADAQHFNQRLLEMAEGLVNRLNERGRKDLIRFAEAEVEIAKARATAAAVAVARFRNESGIIDPERQAAVQLQMVSKLQDELIATNTQLSAIRTLAPRSPQLAVLESKARSLRLEIDVQMGKIAGDQRSLSVAVVKYQQLQLESNFAEKQLASTLASLEQARNEARRKQAYVERIVQPNRPDSPLEPRRLRSILAVLAAGLIAFGIAKMLIAGILEHRD